MPIKPLYQVLRERILEDFWVRGHLPIGTKLPTERELARRYRVSCNTVAKTVSALTAEGWVTKRQGSGIYVAAVTQPPKLHGGNQPSRIGVLVQGLTYSLPHRVFEGVELVARKHDWVVEVANSDFDYTEERRQLARMVEHGVLGVVLYPVTARAQGEEYLAEQFRDFPVVVVDLYQPTMRRPHVIFDQWSAGYEMTRHLFAQGRREIAFLKYPDQWPHRSLDDRLAGHRRALDEAGVEFVQQRVIRFESTEPGSSQHRAALDQFLALRPRPTALISIDDRHVPASIAHLRAQGVNVPEDVLVAGFDNLQDPWGERFPTHQPDYVRMGERATEMLLERIATRNFETTGLILPCPLLIPERLHRPDQMVAARV